MSLKDRMSKIIKARRRTHVPAAVLEDGPSEQIASDIPCIVRVIAYSPEKVHEAVITDLAQLRALIDAWPVIWIDITGVNKQKEVEEIAKIFDIHHLVIEDILTPHQRAKLEQYDDDFFLVTHLITETNAIEPKQLSLFFNKNYVLSFQDEPMDGLKCVRNRILNNQGLIRNHDVDYLVYTLVDAVIDSYFPVLERLGERLEDLEDQVIDNPTKESIAQIHIIKRELLILRRAIWPMREAINALLRDATAVIKEEAVLHLRDSYDHAVRVLDFIETYREVGADLMDVYLSSVSNRMNEVMKVLTIIATVFAPPTFIASIYGMNFNPAVSPYNMPETQWYYGYPLILLIMFLATFATISLLWWKGWLGVLVTKSKKDPKA